MKGTKREAESKMRELLESLEKGVFVKPNKLTFGGWMDEWLENYAKLHVSPKTWDGYRHIVKRHISPALGALELIKLEPRHLQNHYARELASGRLNGQGGLGNRAVQYQHRIISNALNYAFKMGVINRNVALAVDPPRVAHKAMSVLAADDVERMLNEARQTAYYPVIFTALYTGMRRGELLALKWKDVDLTMARLSVVNSLYRLNGRTVIKEPKSAHGRRMIALPPTLAIMLRSHKAEQQRRMLETKDPLTEEDFVFCHGDGRPFDPDVITSGYAKILKRAALPYMRFHDLRHTHATLMLMAGIHPKIVSERLGHSKVSITLDIYSHIVPGLQEAAAESFDLMMKPKVGNMESVSKC